MAAELSVSEPQRLAGQLRALSEITETLTIRLLELEERLEAQELRLEPLQFEHTDLRMEDTENRLCRLETLLAGGRPTGASCHDPSPMEASHSRPEGLPRPRALRAASVPDQIKQEDFLEDGFQQEEFHEHDFQEQPFLDEQIA